MLSKGLALFVRRAPGTSQDGEATEKLEEPSGSLRNSQSQQEADEREVD